MSFVMAVLEVLATAATDLANLGSTLTVANAAAVVPTTAPTTRCRNSVGRNGIPGKSGHRLTRFGTGFLRGLADVCASGISIRSACSHTARPSPALGNRRVVLPRQEARNVICDRGTGRSFFGRNRFSEYRLVPYRGPCPRPAPHHPDSGPRPR